MPDHLTLFSPSADEQGLVPPIARLITSLAQFVTSLYRGSDFLVKEERL